MRRKYRFQISKFKFPNSNKKGQSLIEVMIAFTVSVVIGVALVTAGLATQRASISARNNSQATKLAQEYLEEIRLMRDVGGFPIPLNDGTASTVSTLICYKFVTPGVGNPDIPKLVAITFGATCKVNLPAGNDDTNTYNGVIFRRRLTPEAIPSNTNATKFTVRVMWKEGTNNRIVTAETTLSQWCNGNITGVNANPCP